MRTKAQNNQKEAMENLGNLASKSLTELKRLWKLHQNSRAGERQNKEAELVAGTASSAKGV